MRIWDHLRNSVKFSNIPMLSTSIVLGAIRSEEDPVCSYGICDQTEFFTIGVLSLREEVTCRHFNLIEPSSGSVNDQEIVTELKHAKLPYENKNLHYLMHWVTHKKTVIIINQEIILCSANSLLKNISQFFLRVNRGIILIWQMRKEN